eukprot:7151721-Prymnesium_polylepis.1
MLGSSPTTISPSVRGANKANDTLETLPEFLYQQDYFAHLNTKVKGAQAHASAAVKARYKAVGARAVAVRASK